MLSRRPDHRQGVYRLIQVLGVDDVGARREARCLSALESAYAGSRAAGAEAAALSLPQKDHSVAAKPVELCTN